MTPTAPHFDLPFRIENGQAVVVEQNTDREISNAAEAVLRYVKGSRIELPGFGVPDQTFRKGGADLDAIRQALNEWEPRYLATFDRDPNALRDLADRITVSEKI